MAVKIKRNKTMAPTTAFLLRRSCSRAKREKLLEGGALEAVLFFISNTRIEKTVSDIDHQVDQHITEGCHQDCPLDHGKIFFQNPTHSKTPYAWPSKDGFNDDRPTQQPAKLES